ncbi:unnamed protein product, partial [Ixodes pacificus]
MSFGLFDERGVLMATEVYDIISLNLCSTLVWQRVRHKHKVKALRGATTTQKLVPRHTFKGPKCLSVSRSFPYVMHQQFQLHDGFPVRDWHNTPSQVCFLQQSQN